MQHAAIEATQRHGRQPIEIAYRYCGGDSHPAAEAAFRSMNAAEMVQHGPQQTRPPRGLGSDLARRKFHCVFKDSSGK
jgi:hypothetical protein